MNPRKTVLFLTEETFHAYGRGICRGIARYAERNPAWSLVWSYLIERVNRPKSLPPINPKQIDGILMRIASTAAVRRIALFVLTIGTTSFSLGLAQILLGGTSLGSMAPSHYGKNKWRRPGGQRSRVRLATCD